MHKDILSTIFCKLLISKNKEKITPTVHNSNRDLKVGLGYLSSDIGTWNTNTGNIPGRLGQVLNFAMSVIHSNGFGPNFQGKKKSRFNFLTQCVYLYLDTCFFEHGI